MLIVGVTGSPRVCGNTDLMLEVALDAARTLGADVKLIRISDYYLSLCSGCMGCFGTKKCANEDDIEKLYGVIIKADGIIMGSPSYFQGVTAQTKIFVDRVGFLALARGRKAFAEKVGGVIAAARRSGVSSTCNQMIAFLTAVGITNPSGGRVFVIGRERGEVAKDQEGIDSAKHLGKMIARTIAQINEKR